MKIITVPHPTLRVVAQPVTQVDKKLFQIVDGLQSTLQHTKKPRGVGLAAPQVNNKWRLFATQLSAQRDNTKQRPSAKEVTELRTFINPEIIDHSQGLTLGPNPEEPILEGCLSIPEFYGPVPRWEWVELRFQVIEENQLAYKTEKFSEFAARVIQHEYDHLDGILFIDHVLKYDLPLFKDDPKQKELIELEKSMVRSFVEHTR